MQDLYHIKKVIYNIKSLIQKRERQRLVLQEFILDTIEPDRVLKRSLEDSKECRKRKFTSRIYTETLSQLNIINKSLSFLKSRLFHLQVEIDDFS